MKPRQVLPINYLRETDGPWPQILKTVSVVAIVFAAVRVGSSALGLKSMLGYPGGSSADWQVRWFWVAFALEIALDLLLAVGALRLLMRPGRYRLLMLAAAISCATSLLGLILPYIMRYIVTLEQFVSNLLNTVLHSILPALLILLLWQYKKEQRTLLPAAAARN